jgi:hypothetical protein
MHEESLHQGRIILLEVENFTEETNFTDERKIVFGRSERKLKM